MAIGEGGVGEERVVVRRERGVGVVKRFREEGRNFEDLTLNY